MVHKGGTHPENTEMLDGVTKRKNTYYFRKRIPQDLLGHPEYGGKKEIKKSLKTCDPKEANRRAMNIAAELENTFLALRQQLANEEAQQTSSIPIPVVPMAKSGKVTEEELDRIWVEEYERLEKEEILARNEIKALKINSTDVAVALEARDAREEALSTFYAEYMVVNPCGDDVREAIDWEKRAEERLKLNGLSRSDLSVQDFEYLATQLQAVNAEVLMRTIDVARGKPPKVHDVLLMQAIDSHKLRLTHRDMSRDTVVNGVTIRELGEEFLKVKKGTHPESVRKGEYKFTLRIFSEFFGEETIAESITNEQCHDFMEFLRSIPSNGTKKYGDVSLHRMVELSGRIPEAQRACLSPSTQKKHFIRIQSMLSSGHKGLGLVQNCPLARTSFTQMLPKVEKKEKNLLSDNDLNKILSDQDFNKHAYKQGDGGVIHAGRYWAVLLSMHQGNRVNEACQLLQTDVREHEGVHYLNFGDADEAVQQSLKTAASKRLVPIHKNLIELGFLDFCKAQKLVNSSPYLFPDLARDPKTGLHSAPVVRLFARLSKKHVSKEDRPNNGDKTIHTLRHRVASMLRNENVPDEKRFFLQGWTTEGIKLNAGAGYGGRLDELANLKEILDRCVVYPDFDYDLLDRWEP